MKNRFFIFFLSLFFSSALMAQSVRIGQHDAIARWTTTPANNLGSAAEGRQMIQEVIDVVGLKPNFEIQTANIPNAAAIVYGGKRYILYNPDFISQLTKATGNKWAAVSVLAHEIGHHLNGHTLSGNGSQPQLELDADEFSGFVLRKMGANIQQAQAALKIAAQQRATTTHPAQYDRLAAIEKGWKHADDQMAGRNTVAKVEEPVYQQPNPVYTQPRVARQTVIDERNIIGLVRFIADPQSSYYVTTRYNLVKVQNNQISAIGKLAKLNSAQFPYMIYDESNTQLLVDAGGNILTKRGQKVGFLKPN
jgi:hypothetical protein